MDLELCSRGMMEVTRVGPRLEVCSYYTQASSWGANTGTNNTSTCQREISE